MFGCNGRSRDTTRNVHLTSQCQYRILTGTLWSFSKIRSGEKPFGQAAQATKSLLASQSPRVRGLRIRLMYAYAYWFWASLKLPYD